MPYSRSPECIHPNWNFVLITNTSPPPASVNISAFNPFPLSLPALSIPLSCVYLVCGPAQWWLPLIMWGFFCVSGMGKYLSVFRVQILEPILAWLLSRDRPPVVWIYWNSQTSVNQGLQDPAGWWVFNMNLIYFEFYESKNQGVNAAKKTAPLGNEQTDSWACHHVGNQVSGLLHSLPLRGER